MLTKQNRQSKIWLWLLVASLVMTRPALSQNAPPPGVLDEENGVQIVGAEPPSRGILGEPVVRLLLGLLLLGLCMFLLVKAGVWINKKVTSESEAEEPRW